MKFYLAPLEGITGYIYRNALHDFFGTGIDKYFMPFLAPHTKRSFNAKEKNDILPEHNQGMQVIPQVLTNRAEDFLRIEKDLKEFGYEEININLGCPAGTVVAKGRGAGFLAETDKLEHFLTEIFAKTEAKISLKTRIGKEDTEEFYRLLEIYNQYPLEELIIHPRIQKELYRGKPHREMFSYAIEHSKNPLCYNGDIFTVEDYVNLKKELSDVAKDITGDIAGENTKSNAAGDTIVRAVMLGRGVLKNPALISQLAYAEEAGAGLDNSGEGSVVPDSGIQPILDRETLRAFHDRLLSDYQSVMSGDKNVLFKMKEVWSYMIELFPDSEKTAKKIRKADRLREYEAAVQELFDKFV